MEGALHRFIRWLRVHGVRVSTAEAIDAMHAVSAPGVLDDRPPLLALAAPSDPLGRGPPALGAAEPGAVRALVGAARAAGGRLAHGRHATAHHRHGVGARALRRD